MKFRRYAVIAIAIAVVITWCAGHNAGAAGKPTIFIKNLVAGKGVSAGDASKLSRLIEETIINMGKYDVMSQDQVKELFETAARQQMMDCNSEACLKEIMRTTQTDYIIYGEILKEENEYVISVKLMERRKGGDSVVTGSSTRFTRTFDSRPLKLLAENIVKQLHGQKITESEENDIGNVPEGLVKFRVICDPADADLYVNGKHRKSKSQMFPEGEYGAVLKSPGYEDYSFTIDLPSKTEYNIKLKRLKYKISFDLEKGMDSGVDVYEDENRLGTIEKKGITLNLESGGHILTFKKRGYDDRIETYNFSQNRSYVIKLKKSVYDLNITSSEDGTQVYINGKQAGKAPYTKKLEYGTYKIRVEKDGFLAEEKEIELDRNITLNFSLREKKFVEFRVETNPQGADVYFGGKKRGTAPGTFQFPEGDVKIEVVYEGIRLDKDITLRAGGKAQVVSFDFKYCMFKVESNPAGADVYINGKKAGTTPGSFTAPEGEVKVKVESAGKKREKTVTLKYGAKEQRISFDFTKSEYKTGQLQKFGNIEMVYIEGGTFTMGSPESESDRGNDEKQHRVTVSPFWMGKYEVTQKQYEDVMGTNPSSFKGNSLPVEQVSWYDAVEYCNKLSEKQGLQLYYKIDTNSKDPNNTNNDDYLKLTVTIAGGDGYRLPTEAEWEYACRGGTKKSYYWGDEINKIYCWYDDNSYLETHPVGEKKSNAWGLYDMSGNVWEWCWDWYDTYSGDATDPRGADSGICRVTRGGSWNYSGSHMRSPNRGGDSPHGNYVGNGFRLVRTVN